MVQSTFEFHSDSNTNANAPPINLSKDRLKHPNETTSVADMVPRMKLYNGLEIPSFGLGTWKVIF